jgi:hypothetical protein
MLSWPATGTTRSSVMTGDADTAFILYSKRYSNFSNPAMTAVAHGSVVLVLAELFQPGHAGRGSWFGDAGAG